MVWTDEEICNAIDDLRADRRATTIEAIGEKLGVDDLEALNARLLQAAKEASASDRDVNPGTILLFAGVP